MYVKGLAYQGLVRVEETKKRQYVAPRNERKLGARCNCKLSKIKSLIKCNDVSDQDRAACFKEFWALDWAAKKATIRSLITTCSPEDKRHRKRKNEVSRRSQTLQFHLKAGENADLVRVCKTMFLQTVGLKEWTVLNWVKSGNNPTLSVQDGRKRESERRRNTVKEYLSSLAKMESHYCRAGTSKVYLEPVWNSKQHVYREYVVYCQGIGERPVESTVFTDVFEEQGIGLFSPRKDQCDTCLAYMNKSGSICEEDYQFHILKKDEARTEMNKDIAEVQNKFVFTMDVQAVVVCPRTKASASYYKTKLAIHNFTVYNMKSEDGYCFIWDETEADLSANVFATLIVKFLEDNVPFQKGDHVILWSDGCPYQNRNAVVSNALVNFSMMHGITIMQKYLEKGHTQMQCDAMHATIERKCRKKEIYLPSAFETFCREARLNPRPYITKYMHFEDFLNYSKISFYPSIRPGKKKGDATVVDIRALKYTPDGAMFHKLYHSDEWTEYDRRKTPMKPKAAMNRLFQQRLPIKGSKYKHLQELKEILPRDVHSFYDNLPHFD